MARVKTKGTLFKRGDGGGPETFTNIGQVVGFTGPDGEAADIDTTDLDSVAKEFEVGLPEEGNISMNINIDPANAEHSGLRTDRDAGTLRNFQIVLPDAGTTTLSFAAYVKSYSLDAQPDDIFRLTVNLRISGAVTWA